MAILSARDVFATPPLTASVIDELKAQALATATLVIERSQQAGTTPSWSLVSSDNALRIFKANDSVVSSNFLHCGQLQVCAPLADVVELLRTDTPAHATAFKQRFGKDIMTTSTLYTLEPPTADTPNHRILISWLAFQSPMKNVVMNRDVLVLEVRPPKNNPQGRVRSKLESTSYYQRPLIWVLLEMCCNFLLVASRLCHREFSFQGRRGWVRAGRSIQLPGCPNLEASCGLVRMQNYGSGHVLIESVDKPGFLDMSYVTEVDMQVGASEWAVDAFRSRDFLIEKAIARRCQSLVEIERYLQGHINNSQAMVVYTYNSLKATTSRKALRRHCCLCDKRFGPLSKKVSCSQCPLVMCRRCDREWQLKSHAHDKSMCTSCALGSANTPTMTDAGQSTTTHLQAGDRGWNSESSLSSRRDDSTGLRPLVVEEADDFNSSSNSSSSSRKDSSYDMTAPRRRQYQPCVLYKANSLGGFVLLRTNTTTPVVFDRMG
ncbi:hypothetical protein AaE_010114 [Aphanomyces astaci]|uniref:FYVE-type domain-containing protein n=1 Tax=Aphanomyces astaci TaxID=112090 RepID=A0A6A5A353_APHAT|nr:hypothetical protein AaE_010114 [Aphanomyces astaci]